jgi:hypothetical protein
MKSKLNAEQSSHKVLKITPFIPLTLKGERGRNNFCFSDYPPKTCPEQGRRIRGGLPRFYRGRAEL